MVSVRLVDPSSFDATQLDVVRQIASGADEVDGVENLNEQARLHLKHRGLRDAALWLADDGDTAQGFAFRHPGDLLDLVVTPQARGRGLGAALADAALAGQPSVEAWSHGDHPAAGRLAARHGVPRARELRVMARRASEEVAPPEPPAGVRIRTFTDADAEAVLAVNRTAFAHHPEQGRMTLEELRERTEEDWFDPAGLFLAVSDDPAERLLGFHWTKLHREADPPFGEVYVVAVNPKAAGRGLGTLLTQVGLRHLATSGVEEVVLYVEGDNDPALAVYRKLGFRDVRTEAQYRGDLVG